MRCAGPDRPEQWRRDGPPEPCRIPTTPLPYVGAVFGWIAAAKPAEAAAPAGSKNFYLNNATMADAGRDRPAVGTSGLSLTGYRLDGDSEKLTPHLNHQVRVVGTVQNAAGAGPAAAPTLKVDSVTMVSAKCEPATGAKPQ